MKKEPLFEKILVANRGEIALRIMKTLKKMNIKSVAVYSEADSNAQHVQFADEAHYIGSSSAKSSYLSIQNIIYAIRKSGAQAVHPGYGFLSENPNFANVLKREGVTLIGPSANIIKKMGDKIEAKKIAIEAGVTTVPGYIGSIINTDQALKIATDIGFPIMIKAAAGGGGRGMRVVNNAEELIKAYDSARIESENNFQDSRVFIEKYVKSPRHIEIQLLADQYGNSVCLGERECSIQRYHQKIIEEAPSSFIDPETRQKIYREVINLSNKVQYFSAGTVEFMVDKNKNYYFLEMNTRLQVEHPVTELITGIDIVEEMVKIAAHQKLSFSQQDIKFKGWSIESRIYAEDPSRGFLPSSGRVFVYQEPPKNSKVRIDSAIGAGDNISMFYDPMIAKLCSYGENREEALKVMSEALSMFVIKGIAHNISFLETVINHPRFISGDINTAFIEEEYPEGFVGAEVTSELTEVFLAISVYLHISEQKRIASISDKIGDQISKIGTRWVITLLEQQIPIIVREKEINSYQIRSPVMNRINITSDWVLGNSLIKAIINGKAANVKIENISTGYKLTYSGLSVKTFVRSPRISELEALMPPDSLNEEINQKFLLSPLAGKISSIEVTEGEEIKIGQNLLVITAMKMDNTILSDRNAVISKISIKKNQDIVQDQLLIEFN
ncbi:MAG: acetyl-CoA carboxylase biotin carboxylase subunit [Rickettsia sp.]|nr:acetyl-CoA carboxylase biotin carboxylase subunit [Rickettsia sp.]